MRLDFCVTFRVLVEYIYFVNYKISGTIILIGSCWEDFPNKTTTFSLGQGSENPPRRSPPPQPTNHWFALWKRCGRCWQSSLLGMFQPSIPVDTWSICLEITKFHQLRRLGWSLNERKGHLGSTSIFHAQPPAIQSWLVMLQSLLEISHQNFLIFPCLVNITMFVDSQEFGIENIYVYINI